MHLQRFVWICSLSALVACGSSSDPAEGTLDQRTGDSIIAAPLNRAIERAEDVETTIQDQAEELRRRIEAAEGR